MSDSGRVNKQVGNLGSMNRQAGDLGRVNEQTGGLTQANGPFNVSKLFGAIKCRVSCSPPPEAGKQARQMAKGIYYFKRI